MQIYNLTGKKYSRINDVFWGVCLDEYVVKAFAGWYSFNRNFLLNRYYLGTIVQKMRSFLQEVPVFLVDSSMSPRPVNIPNTRLVINVPSDSFVENVDVDKSYKDFFRRLAELPEIDIEEELDRKRGEGKRDVEIPDLLGIYVSNPNDSIPSRIFVWVDKIYKCAHGKEDDFQALLEQTILHEYAHALMDVMQFGFNHTKRFGYSDYPYRYIEEACANAMSLWCGFNSWSPKQQTFIESFVKSQPKEYVAGWRLFQNSTTDFVEFWMQAKVHLNKEIIITLAEFWRSKDFHCVIGRNCLLFTHDNIMLVEHCGQDTWAYKERTSGNLLGLIQMANMPNIICTPKYNSFWSFGADNLCMVRLGAKYGYIDINGNEQIKVKYDYIYTFENGLAVARLNGCYGIINEHDVEVVPFNLDYPDMRGLRNGYATMKNNQGKWGAIDSKGKVVIPCEYDSLVIFDEGGVACVEKDGRKIEINTKGDCLS